MTSRPPWWKGPRGEWYVVVQLAVFLLIAFGPRGRPALPEWGHPFDRIAGLAGGCLLILGGILTAAGFLSLGANLSLFPRPPEKGELVEKGAYRLVRHPIYSGVFFAALGWGMWLRSWPATGYALILFVVHDLKARREERWLLEKFPGYEGYRKRVRRLIPFIY
jgi:protein-S-isoprenylcysteine O-methyltransferase Ste14